MSSPRPLNQIQKWMQAVITHPHSVEEGIASEDARTQIDVPLDSIETVIERSRALTSLKRLGVYANAYYARLLECLTEEFPALVHAVGEEAFQGLAFEYLQDCPSSSYTLNELGTRFPEYLDSLQSSHESHDSPDWLDFLVDLARLQRTYSEVFDGPGNEGQPRLRTETLISIPPDRWNAVRFQMAPCLRLEKYRFPVHVYASQVRLNEEPEFPEPEDVHLAISRIQYRVRRWELSPLQYRLLESLLAGETLGEAIVRAMSDKEIEPDEIASQLRDWFEEWAECGFFTGILDENMPTSTR